MLDAKFWNKYFEVYDALNELIPYQDLLNTIVDKLEVKPGDKILDAGSGTGNLAMKLKAKGADVAGIDISPEGVARHKKKDPGAKVIIQSLTDPLPFPDEAFDKICSNNTIYAIGPSKRPELFKEFYRVLKPGGRLVVSNIVQGFKPAKIYISHLQEYSRKKGVLSVLRNVIKFLIPTVKIFYYNMLVKRENSEGSFSFMKKNDQQHLLKETKFKTAQDSILLYAEQAILDVGIKI